MTDNKKKKKLNITEGTGGSHSASVAAGGPVMDENQRDLHLLRLSLHKTILLLLALCVRKHTLEICFMDIPA